MKILKIILNKINLGSYKIIELIILKNIVIFNSLIIIEFY